MSTSEDIPEINWGYNCLTNGIHHGNPEALWNLPLLQAVEMFKDYEIGDLVIARIHNDAMQYVDCSPFVQKETGETTNFKKEWADQITALAAEKFSDIFEQKVDELRKYYGSSSWSTDVAGVIERVKANKLNPHYQPLHGHDSLNLLCRIIGVSSCLSVE